MFYPFLEELYQTASEFILIDHGKIIEEISDYELVSAEQTENT